MSGSKFRQEVQASISDDTSRNYDMIQLPFQFLRTASY